MKLPQQYLIKSLIIFALMGTGCGKDDAKSSDPLPPGEGSDLLPKQDKTEEQKAPSGSKPTASDEETDDTDGETSPTTLQDNGIPAGFNTLEEINKIDPEKKSKIIFDGRDAGEILVEVKCSIYIVGEAKDKNGNPRYFVRSSFHHGRETHSYLTVDLIDTSATKVIGIGSNAEATEQDAVAFDLAEPGNIASATKVNIKWWHINHWDIFSCEQLRVRQ